MKLRNYLVPLLFVLITFSISVQAQKKAKPFKGIITYDVTYPEGKLDPGMEAALPNKMTTYILDDMKKSSMFSSMVNQTEIINATEMTRVALLDVMAQKFAIKSTKEEIEEELAEEPVPEIEYFDETKEIAGYQCQKAEVTLTDENGKEDVIVVYFTEEIPNPNLSFDGEFRNLKGFPLEYTIDAERIVMKFAATEVVKGKVKEKDFEVPDGYQYITADELKKMFSR